MNELIDVGKIRAFRAVQADLLDIERKLNDIGIRPPDSIDRFR